LDVFEAGEFFAVVDRQGAAQTLGNPAECVPGGLAHGRGAFVPHEGRNGVKTLAFDEGCNCPPVVFANDRIAFPVSEAGLFFDSGGALMNEYPVFDDAPIALGIGAFLAFSVGLAQLLIKNTPGALFGVNVSVDGFVRDPHAGIFGEIDGQTPGNLFGRPLIGQSVLDMLLKNGIRQLAVWPAGFSTTEVFALRIDGSIAPGRPGVARYFPPDRTHGPLQLIRYMFNTEMVDEKRFDCYPVRWRKMFVWHRKVSSVE